MALVFSESWLEMQTSESTLDLLESELAFGQWPDGWFVSILEFEKQYLTAKGLGAVPDVEMPSVDFIPSHIIIIM